MDWLNRICKGQPHLALAVPIVMSSMSFLGNLLIALSDGDLDDVEIHNLLSSANGIEALFLVIIMIALSKKKK